MAPAHRVRRLAVAGVARRGASADTRARRRRVADIAAGQQVFDSQCAWCHGAGGTGGTGPDLRRTTLRTRRTTRRWSQIVRNGIPGTEMPSFAIALTESMAWQTAAYVRSLGRTRGAADARRCAARRALLRVRRLRVVPRRQRPRRRARSGADRASARCAARRICATRSSSPRRRIRRAISSCARRTTSGAEMRGIRVNEDVFWIHLRDARRHGACAGESGPDAARSRARRAR